MDNPYFVVLYCQNGGYTVMLDDDGELATFGCRGTAAAVAGNNLLGRAFGFEIHEFGAGETG